jgi:2-polyprenyl-3-methyl-5-hydroxy-6-metoxy-1,4-benzoquinol methylase
MPPLTHRLLQRLDQFNGAHPWGHNANFHRWILRQLPSRFDTAWDVGCGSGDLVRLLARRAKAVHGTDSDPTIIARARDWTGPADKVTFSVGDALAERPSRPCDVITCVATVHHLPFMEALTHFRNHLAPGGTLVIVGCYDEQTRDDYLLSHASVPLNVAIGWVKNRGRQASKPISMTARARPADMSFTDIVRQAQQVLPGAQLHRRLLWRYTLLWHHP